MCARTLKITVLTETLEVVKPKFGPGHLQELMSELHQFYYFEAKYMRIYALYAYGSNNTVFCLTICRNLNFKFHVGKESRANQTCVGEPVFKKALTL